MIVVDGVVHKGRHCSGCCEPMQAGPGRPRKDGLCSTCRMAKSTPSICKSCQLKFWDGVGWGFCSEECRGRHRARSHIGRCECGTVLHRRASACSNCRTEGWPKSAVHWCVACSKAFGGVGRPKACAKCRPAFRSENKRKKDRRRRARLTEARQATRACPCGVRFVSASNRKWCSSDCPKRRADKAKRAPRQWGACEVCAKAILVNAKTKVCGGDECLIEQRRIISRKHDTKRAKQEICCKRCGAFVRKRDVGDDFRVSTKSTKTCEKCRKETKAANAGALWAARTPKQAARRRRMHARRDGRRAGFPDWLVKRKEALAMVRGVVRDLNSERKGIYEG